MNIEPTLASTTHLERVQDLYQIVDRLKSVAVAFSAGVDSTLMLKVCADRLPGRVVGAIGVSPSLAPGELGEARKLAAHIGVELVEIETSEIEDERYSANPSNRCYFCKRELYRLVLPLAQSRGLAHVVDGMNADDTGDHRPGARASDQAGVRHPLLEAGFTKADVRTLAQALVLPNWDKPALACLSSRVPYGTSIDAALLQKIGAAESALKDLGFASVRIRVHGDSTRLEVPGVDLQRAFDRRAAVIAAVKNAGFAYVALDLEGYRSGSMNLPILPPAEAS